MKKTPSHFTARIEIEQQILFFSFGFARVTEVRHIYVKCTLGQDYTKETREHDLITADASK